LAQSSILKTKQPVLASGCSVRAILLFIILLFDFVHRMTIL